MGFTSDGQSVSDEVIRGLAQGERTTLESVVGLRQQNLHASGLEPRTHALVKVAALVALGAPSASYLWQVNAALEQGVTPADLVGVLVALGPQVGAPRVIQAAGELALALGITPDEPTAAH